MSSNEDWLTRQQRMVKCPKHGLHFDPKMSSGCIRCLKERAKIRRRRPPQLIIILLCTLGIAVALFRMFGPKLGPQEEALEGLEIIEVSPDRLLNPEAYRQNITSLEIALFDEGVLKASDLESARERIRSAMDTLRDALRERDADAVATREVADMSQGLTTTPWTFESLESLRDRWLRVRRRHFNSAEWYRTPAASEQSATATQRASVAEYRDIADELASLLRQGSSEVSGWPADTGARKESWRGFAEYLNNRLRDLAARRPSRPRADSNAALLVSFQNLERAFNMARALGASSQPPADASRFDEALRTAEDAVVGFERAM